jgi:hypothetical protein
MLGITASTSSPSPHINHDAFLSIADVSPPIQYFPPSTAPIPNITINISNLSADSGSAYTLTQSKHSLTTSSCSNLTLNPPLHSQVPGTIHDTSSACEVELPADKVWQGSRSWKWDQGNFIPFYIYQLVSRLTDYWTKWMEGISGFISTRELTEVWRVKWRHNNGEQRTECGRQKKVIDLVTAPST